MTLDVLVFLQGMTSFKIRIKKGRNQSKIHLTLHPLISAFKKVLGRTKISFGKHSHKKTNFIQLFHTQGGGIRFFW